MSLEEQPEPDKATCPFCGAEPTDQSKVEHRLASIGYLHDDISYECDECERTFTHGMPIGEPPEEYYRDLRCSNCGDGQFGRVHYVTLFEDSMLLLKLKCPECMLVWDVHRRLDAQNAALVGFPGITGDIEKAERSYGHYMGQDDPS